MEKSGSVVGCAAAGSGAGYNDSGQALYLSPPLPLHHPLLVHQYLGGGAWRSRDVLGKEGEGEEGGWKIYYTKQTKN